MSDIEELPVIEQTEQYDHPDEVTEEEAEAGQVMYNEVDDLDDTSNGIDQ